MLLYEAEVPSTINTVKRPPLKTAACKSRGSPPLHVPAAEQWDISHKPLLWGHPEPQGSLHPVLTRLCLCHHHSAPQQRHPPRCSSHRSPTVRTPSLVPPSPTWIGGPTPLWGTASPRGSLSTWLSVPTFIADMQEEVRCSTKITSLYKLFFSFSFFFSPFPYNRNLSPLRATHRSPAHHSCPPPPSPHSSPL